MCARRLRVLQASVTSGRVWFRNLERWVFAFRMRLRKDRKDEGSLCFAQPLAELFDERGFQSEPHPAPTELTLLCVCNPQESPLP